MTTPPNQKKGKRGPLVVAGLVIGAGVVGVGMLIIMLSWDTDGEPDYEGQPTPGAVVFPPPIADD